MPDFIDVIPPRLLITRFSPHAERLAKRLITELDIFNIAQPLLKVVQTDEFDCAETVLNKSYDHIIAVSTHAVEYTDQALLGNWPKTHYVAVGKATKRSLEKCVNERVSTPKVAFNSEGLLDLAVFQNVNKQKILILRGKGGREFLADTLKSRGAEVTYFQPYQRVAVTFANFSFIKKCQQKKINGAIITSIELLNQLINITQKEDIDWLKSITIYSASQRISTQANELGWDDTITLPGISDQEIISYFNERTS